MPLDLDDLGSRLWGYTIQHGRVVDPGPYEGQPAYAPYFHRLWNEGVADILDGASAAFYLDADDHALFPELAGMTLVVLSEDAQGFVTAHATDHTTDPD